MFHRLLEQKPFSPSAEAILAYVRLGHKYQFSQLYNLAMAFLKSHFVTDLARWSKIRTWVPQGFRHIHAVAIVNIARMTKEYTLLPTALLMCCRISDKIDCLEYTDGETETLSKDDLELCFNAHQKLMTATMETFMGTLFPVVSENCTRWSETHNACVQTALKICNLLPESAVTSLVARPNPVILGASQFGDEIKALCPACKENILKRQKRLCERGWNALPRIFELEDKLPFWGKEVGDS